jgi:hypothetical protein
MATLSYDRDDDVYTIRLRDGSVARTIELPDGVHLVDLDDDDRPVRLEVLDPAAADIAGVAQQFDLGIQVEELLALVRGACPLTTSGSTRWFTAAISTVVSIGRPSSPSVSLPAVPEATLVA